MPELPDLSNYIESLKARTLNAPVTGIRVASPFVLRTATPPVEEVINHKVLSLSRLGKRIVIALEADYFIAIHLMIAGRLRWYDAGAGKAGAGKAGAGKPGARIPGKVGLIAFDLPTGTLILTEAGQKHRASVHLIQGQEQLRAFDPGGADVFTLDAAGFKQRMTMENHTIKRSLTDQKFLAGIGNAYSDEILHHARISPMRQTRLFTDDEWLRLYDSTRTVLAEWQKKLRAETGDKFPARVTAFHPDMAVHGKHRQPCPECGRPIQRIRYADNECNYCAECQNQGKLLADRSLSRLLKKDWPKTLDELESTLLKAPRD